MSSNTPNLDLLKKDPIEDANDTFNIKTMMNDNWDKIDAAVGELKANGSADDNRIGDRTISDAAAPTSNTGKLTSLLNGFAHMIKAITGGATWRTLPSISLSAIKTILDAATNAATANTMIKRDANGRAKVAAPSAADDIARKAEVDAVQANLTAHVADAVKHITAAERAAWNAKETPAGAQAKADAAISAAATDATSKVNSHAADAVKHITTAERTNWNNKMNIVDLRGQLQRNSYRRSVIALCSVDNTDINANSYSAGTLKIKRSNGIHPYVTIDVSADKRYNSETMNITYSHNSGDHPQFTIQPCTFTYNGKKYGGLDVYFASAQHEYIQFYGVSNFDIFGIDYLNTQTNTPLIEDIYNSIDRNSTTINKDWYYGGERVPLSDGTVQKGLSAERWNSWKRYISLAEIGMTNNSSVDDIFSAMAVNSVLEFISPGQAPPLYPYSGAIVCFRKVSSNVMYGKFIRGVSDTPTFFESIYSNDRLTKWSGWVRGGLADGTLQDNFNADMVDSFHATQDPTPSTVAVRGSGGALKNRELHTHAGSPAGGVGHYRLFSGEDYNTMKFALGLSGVEGANNAGADLVLWAYNNSGSSNGAVVTVNRATKQVDFSVTPVVGTAATGTNDARAASTSFVTTAINNKTTITGNAGTATKLATARTINGVAFDGTANITIPVPVTSVAGRTGAVVLTGTDVPAATTSARGTVQLSTATNSTSTTLAATASAVKAAYDRAEAAFQSASDGKSLIVDAITGKGISASTSETFPSLASKIGSIPTAAGTYWRTYSGYILEMTKIVYAPDKNIFVGISGSTTTSTQKLAYSYDGRTWHPTSYNSTSRFLTLYYSQRLGKFVAISSGGLGVTSTDGINWTTFTHSMDTYQVETSASGPTYDVIIADSGRYYTSTNGTSWTARTAPWSHLVTYDLIYANGMYVAVGWDGFIATSTNGTTWTIRNSGTTETLYGVTWGKGLFVVVGWNGTILTSPDGITWTARSHSFPPNDGSNYRGLRNVEYGQGLFIAASATSAGYIYLSVDGITWHTYTGQKFSYVTELAYGEGTFIMSVGATSSIRVSGIIDSDL